MADRELDVVVLDACVLAPMPIADTLLRLAESGKFYIPRWSLQILDELVRTLRKFGMTPAQADRRARAMGEVFPEALVEGFDILLPEMANDPKDRHVLAAAVKCGARAIVSDNRKHFPPAALTPYRLECLTTTEFFEAQFLRDQQEFVDILKQQASDLRQTLPQLLARHLPALTRLVHGRH